MANDGAIIAVVVAVIVGGGFAIYEYFRSRNSDQQYENRGESSNGPTCPKCRKNFENISLHSPFKKCPKQHMFHEHCVGASHAQHQNNEDYCPLCCNDCKEIR